MRGNLGAYVVPSDDAGAKLLNGHKGGFGEVVACWALRALFIAPALAVAGVESKKLVKASLVASGAITAWGLAYLALDRKA